MALVLQTPLFTSIASNCWYFLLLLGYFLHPLLSTLLQVASAISNNAFTSVDFWIAFYTTGVKIKAFLALPNVYCMVVAC